MVEFLSESPDQKNIIRLICRFFWLLQQGVKNTMNSNPIGSMGRTVYLPTCWLIFIVNVGKYTSPMDPMGIKKALPLSTVSTPLPWVVNPTPFFLSLSTRMWPCEQQKSSPTQMLHAYLRIFYLKIYHKFIQKNHVTSMHLPVPPHSAWTKIQGASFNNRLPKAFDFRAGETSAIRRKRRKASATSSSWSQASRWKVAFFGRKNPSKPTTPSKNHTLPKTNECPFKKRDYF